MDKTRGNVQLCRQQSQVRTVGGEAWVYRILLATQGADYLLIELNELNPLNWNTSEESIAKCALSVLHTQRALGVHSRGQQN